eukprot:CAMPEP_0117588616 /NCGR_PEP_ID=MMETSP0784-20121206/69950_1 /TAXON_ID=39447 /ORGANISM="" /LENGTH=35 /DNA_ID= /DNA_START= /DNA_END= /DNA_ORIENTATION=
MPGAPKEDTTALAVVWLAHAQMQDTLLARTQHFNG